MRSPELQAVAEFMGATAVLGPDVPLADQRAAWEAAAALVGPVPGTAVEAVDAGGVPAEWVVPPGADREAVVVYLHGGGYGIGSCATHRAVVSELAGAAGVAALVVDYRLAPEHPFPAALEDATAAYRFVLDGGRRPERVALAGDSAGGGLALAAAVDLRRHGLPLPAAVVCVSPFVDLALGGTSLVERAGSDPVLSRGWLELMAANYLAGRSPDEPLASPLYAELAGLPPLLVVVGTDEILYDDATRLVDRADAAGVDVEFESFPGAIHLWMQLAPTSPEARAGHRRVGGFLRTRLHRPL